MDSLLNPDRPPVFCPGCAHELVVKALDRALQQMNRQGHQVVIVSDIGCSGLFDTFFHTHAFHGLHGRALTYGTGLKIARPDLTVIVTMGDGGMGIGGAHFLSTGRRNMDVTLLILNNFNYGMTGGQCSATTPTDARVASGFLNQLEKPVDICALADSAGASFAARSSACRSTELVDDITRAVRHEGFAVLDIWGGCPGRYTRHNPVTPKTIDTAQAELPPCRGEIPANARPEYGAHYRETAAREKPDPGPVRIEAGFDPVVQERREVMMLGSAGQRIVTAGELLCLSGLTSGLHATQKTDYPITVLRGHSVTEVVLDPQPIGYTGIETPDVIIALAPEGINRKQSLFSTLDETTFILNIDGLELPPTAAEVMTLDLKSRGIRSADRALAALGALAGMNRVISLPMLQAALPLRFSGKVLEKARTVIDKAVSQTP